MRSTVLEARGEKSHALVFEAGDEVVAELDRFAAEHSLSASHFTGLGAFSDVVLGFFSIEQRRYERIPIDEQVEVVSFVGDVTSDTDGPKVHAHVVVAKRDGTAHGGHLLCAHVRPTLEVVITESPSHLHRETDASTGLALIKLERRD
jgi:predicted DNA-binding protein with PD1-like motif